MDSVLYYDAQVKAALNNERVLGDLLISTHHAMGAILNMQTLLETVVRTQNPLEQKALADSLNKNTAGFLLTHDPVVTASFITITLIMRLLLAWESNTEKYFLEKKITFILANFKIMKLTLIVALFLITIAGCQFTNKTPDKNLIANVESPSAYMEVSNNIDQLARDILSSIKTNNYATFSNYLSSKDTVLNFMENAFKAGMSAKDLADLKDHADKEYTKTLITTKTDFDYIVKKGTEQGIIWSNVNYSEADWKLSKENIGNFSLLALKLTINFKYRGVDHVINFDDSQAFILIASKWVLSGKFQLDSFNPTDQTDLELHKDNESMSSDTSMMMAEPQKDSMK